MIRLRGLPRPKTSRTAITCATCGFTLCPAACHPPRVKYNPEIHHRRSIRIPEYDYAQRGAYFVTICTHGRECIFSDPGMAEIVAGAWRAVVAIRGAIDEFVVMPNHVHGIVWIVGTQQHHRGLRGGPPVLPKTGATPIPVDGVAASLRRGRRFAFIQRPVESGSLSAIVRTFKSATAKRINNLRGTPGAPLWQRNYYEHIVRDEDDLHRIRQYIRDNPLKWDEDPDNPGRVRERGA